MKNIALFLIVSGCFCFSSCQKETKSESFRFLTGPTWVSDSLLANNVDASGPSGMLKNFKGEAKFNEDGTGHFGVYTGTWWFAFNETQVVIRTDSLPGPLTTQIAELTNLSLKITTTFSNSGTQTTPVNIRMTFKAK